MSEKYQACNFYILENETERRDCLFYFSDVFDMFDLDVRRIIDSHKCCAGDYGNLDVDLCILKSWYNDLSFGYAKMSHRCQHLRAKLKHHWFFGDSIYSYCNIHSQEINTKKMKCFEQGRCPSYIRYGKTPKKTSGGGGSDCYISTACVNARGLPDDCEELELLRRYRDEWVAKDEKIAACVKEYYNSAPLIVSKINDSADAQDVYEHLYSNLVLPCCSLLKDGKIEEAIELYQVTYLELKQKYGIE